MSLIIFKEDKNNFSSYFSLIGLLVAVLSPITHDYRLFFINICLVIYLLNSINLIISGNAILIALLVILIPKEYIWFHLGGSDFNINGPINAILMVFIYLFIESHGGKFHSKLEESLCEYLVVDHI